MRGQMHPVFQVWSTSLALSRIETALEQRLIILTQEKSIRET